MPPIPLDLWAATAKEPDPWGPPTNMWTFIIAVVGLLIAGVNSAVQVREARRRRTSDVVVAATFETARPRQRSVSRTPLPPEEPERIEITIRGPQSFTIRAAGLAPKRRRRKDLSADVTSSGWDNGSLPLSGNDGELNLVMRLHDPLLIDLARAGTARVWVETSAGGIAHSPTIVTSPPPP